MTFKHGSWKARQGRAVHLYYPAPDAMRELKSAARLVLKELGEDGLEKFFAETEKRSGIPAGRLDWIMREILSEQALLPIQGKEGGR